MKLPRRTLLAGALPAGAMLASCRHADYGTSTLQAGYSGDSATLSGKLNVWSWNIAAKALQKLIPLFNRQYPHVSVNVDMTGANLQARFLLSLAAGVGAPEVSQLQFTDAQKYAATGRLTDISRVASKYAADFPESRWRGSTRDGRVFAIPWDIGPCGVFYKRNLFQRYKIEPDRIVTWDDFIAAGKEILRQSGGRTKMLTLGSASMSSVFEILIQQNGGQIFDDAGAVAINSPECAEALGVMKRMWEAGICANVAWWSQEFLAGLNDESIATYPLAVWFGGTIKDSVKDYGGHPQEWGVMRLPAIKPGGLRNSNLGGSVLVIPSQCKQKEAAWAFIEYALCTVEGQVDQYRNMSLFPAYLPALKDPYFDEPDTFFGGHKVSRLFATDVEKVPALNRTEDWAEATRYIDQALGSWAASGLRTEGFFADLEQKLSKRLNRQITPQRHRDTEVSQRGT